MLLAVVSHIHELWHEWEGQWNWANREGKERGGEECTSSKIRKYEPHLLSTERGRDFYGPQQDQQWVSNPGKSPAAEILWGWRPGLAGSFLSILAGTGCVEKTKILLRTAEKGAPKHSCSAAFGDLHVALAPEWHILCICSAEGCKTFCAALLFLLRRVQM